MGLFVRPQRCGFGYRVPAMRPSPRLEDEQKSGVIGGNHLFPSPYNPRPNWVWRILSRLIRVRVGSRHSLT